MVTANFKETQLNKMKAGQEAEIKIDAFPDKIFKGHVESLSPASGAKLSVLPPDNALGNFTKELQQQCYREHGDCASQVWLGR